MLPVLRVLHPVSASSLTSGVAIHPHHLVMTPTHSLDLLPDRDALCLCHCTCGTAPTDVQKLLKLGPMILASNAYRSARQHHISSLISKVVRQKPSYDFRNR